MQRGKKSFFNSIIYVISEENKQLSSYPPHLKNVTALLCKMQNFYIWVTEGNVEFLQMLVALKKAGCGLAAR